MTRFVSVLHCTTGSMYQPIAPLGSPTSERTGPAASYELMSRIRLANPR